MNVKEHATHTEWESIISVLFGADIYHESIDYFQDLILPGVRNIVSERVITYIVFFKVKSN